VINLGFGDKGAFSKGRVIQIKIRFFTAIQGSWNPFLFNIPVKNQKNFRNGRPTVPPLSLNPPLLLYFNKIPQMISERSAEYLSDKNKRNTLTCDRQMVLPYGISLIL